MRTTSMKDGDALMSTLDSLKMVCLMVGESIKTHKTISVIKVCSKMAISVVLGM